jgi:hypothetical protein
MSKEFTNHNGDVYTWDEDAGRYLLTKTAKPKKATSKKKKEVKE